MGAMAVHVVLYREEGQVVAHCLEFDLVAQGTTSDEAYRNLLDAIELQVDFTQATGDLENLIQLAPVEYWQMLARAEPYAPKADGWFLPGFVSHTDCSAVHV